MGRLHADRQVPALVQAEGVAAYRSADIRVEILDRYERFIGSLDGTQPGGSLRWSAQASVKGGGQLTVQDVGQNIDWLNSRLRFVYVTSDDGRRAQETPLGVFLPAAPVADWGRGRRSWQVDVLDKTSILDTDIVTDAAGNAVTVAYPPGTPVLTTVKAIIADAGEQSPAISTEGEPTLAGAMVWDAGTTRLKIVNDLLDAANYFSLWCDGLGRYRASRYVRPSDRAPAYLLSEAFSEGPTALFSDEWKHDEDIYGVPNRYVAIQTGSADEAGLVAVATNTDPESPFSYQARGRWITQTEDAVDAVDQTALDAYAQRKLDAASQVASKITLDHVFLPEVLVNAVVRVTAGNLRQVLATVTNTSIPLDPTKLVTTDVKQVAANE